ncbi:hypothetical protein AB4090_05410 [Acidithiobacillus sp. IBUN Pt1247-S3]|uniref:hypothetical protein n=1 Tax=Acidithiobacillus sp. IBUN Pt1247-S3 TaxID=3166642 RepID=UPI0034E3C8B4
MGSTITREGLDACSLEEFSGEILSGSLVELQAEAQAAREERVEAERVDAERCAAWLAEAFSDLAPKKARPRRSPGPKVPVTLENVGKSLDYSGPMYAMSRKLGLRDEREVREYLRAHPYCRMKQIFRESILSLPESL